MSELMQSSEMPHDTDAQQSDDAVGMSETEIGAYFDEPEPEETTTEQQEEEAKPEAKATPDEPAIPAPATWNESDRDEFERLPRAVQEKIVAREKERDAYLTKRTQEISEKSRQVQSLEALGEALRKDPGLRDHLTAYQQQAAPKPPEDPIERITWEAEQRAVARMQAEYAPLIQQMQHKQAIDATLSQVRQDPHHQEVYGEIGKWLQTMPPSVGKDLYARLDNDPAFFSETYDHYRKQVTSKAPAPKPEAPAAPTPVERKTKAPLLETPGGEQPVESRKKRFSDLKSRAYDGDIASLGALFDM